MTSRHGVLAEYESSTPAEIMDGLSNTLMVAECSGRAASYVLGRPMSASQFARYASDEIVSISGNIVVAEGVGWADPDSGFSIEGTADDGVEIYGPRMINATNVGEAYSFHRGGANFLYADGSVRFLGERIDAWLYVSLCTRAGGEVVR
jgi:prepilin-type processing-associated H-X9-DG protein